ncbi:protein kinase domain-containing protein [Cryobacterium glaciale]|uniref:protein kinase domain-containing protein n=1 Tax=Cryobacterium glaciale TaxID=1259145 RepID=UPI00141A6D2C|nr:protein kinase [Cryobacterium glaciale]
MKRRAEQPVASVDDTAWLRPRRGQYTPPPADSERTTPATIQTEAVVAGHRVIRLLGSGDRATVYLGHSASGNAVALKIFRADTAAASIELDIAVLTSPAAPGLVHLLDVAQLGDGRICLVLERLAGGSLARYLVDTPRLSPGEVVTVLAPVTVALRSMHAAGFAHGGMSQATILLDANGRAVLTGFGAVSQLGDPPGERMRLLRADYERLGLVMESLWDALDAADSYRASGAALLRRFRAAVNPLEIPTRAGRASNGAPLASILETLEHDVFDWADAEPLRGFPLATGANALVLTAPSRDTGSRLVDSVRLRVSGLGNSPLWSGRVDQMVIDEEPEFAADPTDDRGDFDEGIGADTDVDTGFTNGFRIEIENENESESDSGRPRARGGRLAGALRPVPGRRGDTLRTLQPKARLDQALGTTVNSMVGLVVAAVVDSHPLTAAGHALRKRVHGHRRPLLVAALGGAGMLVLVLTLFPVSGRAGDSGPVRTEGAGGSVGADAIPIAPEPADAAADGAGAAGTTAAPGDRPSSVDRSADENQTAIAGDDPVAAVVALLARRASCLAAASLVCLVDVDQTGSSLLALDSYDARDRQQGGSGGDLADYVIFVPSLAERIGDLAVVALTPPPGEEKSQPASVLVVKGEGGWRLREIFDY